MSYLRNHKYVEILRAEEAWLEASRLQLRTRDDCLAWESQCQQMVVMASDSIILLCEAACLFPAAQP